jgi:DNA-binding transcriptional LysR family regulator
MLQDLHILDLLELAGSQAKAGLALAMHQSTVCRSLRLLQQELRLEPAKGAAICRHGHNTCLKHLRLAYRAHRLMEGVLRLGSDALHHSLISRLNNVQQVPPRFRSAEQWAQLIRHGLLDGAVLSSLGLEQRLLSGQVPRWDGLAAKPLGTVALQLVATSPTAKRVLLPNKATTPLLHQTLDWHGLKIETQPSACQEPAAWLKRARDRGAALPICPALVGEPWLAANGLVVLQKQPPLVEQLWLLVPEGTANNNAARQLLRQLRSQISAIQAMQDPHGSQA